MRQLKTQPLTAERISQAFPLIQTSLPEVSLEEWREFASKQLNGQGEGDSGILTVVSEGGCITGLCSYQIESDLVHGRSLTVDHFLAFDLFDPGAVARVLVESVESLARTRQCTAVHTNLISRNPTGRLRSGTAQSRNGRLVDVLSKCGHEFESICLCKRLPA